MPICVLLVACGNKGDLYIEQVPLTEEQKALLDNLERSDSSDDEEAQKKKKSSQSETSKPETPEGESEPSISE